MISDKLFSKKDALDFLDIMDSSLKCKTDEDFFNILTSFRDIIGMEHVFCTKINISGMIRGEELEDKPFNLSYPQEFLEIYHKENFFLYDHVLIDFFKTFKIQRWKDAIKRHDPASWGDALSTLAGFEMNDGFVYGVRDEKGINGNCFFMSDKNIRDKSRNTEIIKLLIPHFSEAFNKVLNKKEEKVFNLTEKEVLNWIKEGKSSWEVSVILNRSERVINFHIDNLLKKMNAMNRTHAVVKAIRNKIIEI